MFKMQMGLVFRGEDEEKAERGSKNKEDDKLYCVTSRTLSNRAALFQDSVVL